MIKKLSLLFANNLLLFLLIASCNIENKYEQHAAEIKLDVKSFDANQLIPEKIIKKINFIPLETDKDFLITSIGKMYKYKSYFIVKDENFRQPVLVFNEKGKFITSIGKYGRGPSELINFSDFSVNEDQNIILILDHEQSKILTYSLSGFKYIEEIKLKDISAKNLSMIGENTLSLYSIVESKFNDKNYIVNYNPKNKSVKGYIKRSKCKINHGFKYSIFESKNQYFAGYFNNTIYKLTENGPKPYIIMDFGDNAFPCVDYEKNQIREAVGRLYEQKQWIYGVNNVTDNDRVLTFNIKLFDNTIQIIYSKKTGNYYYGKAFNNNYQKLGRPTNIAADDNAFYGFIDGFVFQRMEKIINDLPDCPLKVAYLKTFGKVTKSSNPIIVATEYKEF